MKLHEQTATDEAKKAKANKVRQEEGEVCEEHALK
jgi:hypothetical protein